MSTVMAVVVSICAIVMGTNSVIPVEIVHLVVLQDGWDHHVNMVD